MTEICIRVVVVGAMALVPQGQLHVKQAAMKECV